MSDGSSAARRRGFVDTPAFLALVAIVGVWDAASSGYPVHTRVYGGAMGALAAVFLVVALVRRRRKRAAADQG
ncbi:GlyGly-CTERM sorting domain-containing protein [Streptomyces sp. CA-146814]|uniref:GlyGly-CTERM sorting domain-containing protein n=1 Tax=Streptomyces sp. CA-146814 TaxID=3240053 RepID=UPI003D8C3427